MPVRQDDDPRTGAREETDAAPGRAAQRRRTRAAIVAAARSLLAQGASPTIDDVAAAADVSRRTVYMYFPTLDQLLLDAAVGLLTETTVAAVDFDALGDDVVARVDALACALLDDMDAALPYGRKIIALTVDAPDAAIKPDGGRRGHRRIDWIEQAVAPLRARLDAERGDALVSALSLVLGWEAVVVLRDVRGLDRHRERNVVRSTARVIVEAAERDAAPSPAPSAAAAAHDHEA